MRPSALADPDPALFAHELTHLAQHRNRAAAAVTRGSAPGAPGRRPSVTEAEAEAAALADATRHGTPLWRPRAVLPDGHLARVSGSTGVMPARPSDAGPGNTPNPGVPSLQPAVAAGQTAATLSALTDVVRRTHSAELDRIKAEMSTFGEIAPDKRDYALSVLDQVPFVVGKAMVSTLDSDQRQRLAQLSDRDHQRHPAAAVAVLAALKTDEMDALGDKLIKGKDAALHGVQFGRLEPTALRALYGVLGQLRDSQLAQLTGGDRRDYFRGRLAIAPPEGSDQDALESAFNNESEQDKVRRTSIGESGTPGGSQGAETPIIISGTPQQMVNELIARLRHTFTPQDIDQNLAIIVSTGLQLIVFIAGRRQGTFDLEKNALDLPAGVFHVDKSGSFVEQAWQSQGGGPTVYYGVPAAAKEQRTVDLVVTEKDQRARYLRLRGGRDIYIMRGRGSPGGTGADGGEGADKAAGDQSGAGGGGTGTAPPIPDWAVVQFRVVRDRVIYEKTRIRSMAGRTADEHDDKALDRLLILAAVPTRVILASDGSTPLIAAEVPGHSGAIALVKGQGPGLVWERVQALTRVLNAGLRPNRNASPGDMLLGVPSDKRPDPDRVPPNTEAYPSEIVNLGPAIGIANAVHRFQMDLDWTVEGQFATFAAFGPRRYQWDVFQLRRDTGALSKGEPGKPDAGRHVKPSEAARAEAGEGFQAIWEDVDASVHEEVINEGTATLIAIDAAVRSVGTLVGGFVSVVSTPRNEQGVQWEGPGTYVVRCMSARAPLSREDASKNPVVRAPSVALFPIRVMTAQAMAVSLTAPTKLNEAEAGLAALTHQLETASSQNRAGLEEQIRAQRDEVDQLRAADARSAGADLDVTAQESEEQILMAQMVADLRGTGEPEKWRPLIEPNTPALLRPPKMTADMLYGLVVGLHVQLTLAGREPATVIQELRLVLEQTRQRQTALREIGDRMKGPQFRPHMSFVPREDGRSLPLTMVLAQARDSDDSSPKWLLFDLSTPGHHDSYEGSSSRSGAEGHATAIRGAILKFAGQVPYGLGTVGVRLPEALAMQIGAVVDVSATIEARPDESARWRQRLESLASAAGIAALVVSGPVGVALGVVGGVAGGVVAAYRIYRRYDGGYLEMDLATVMDITTIVGAVAAPAGAWAGSVRAGARGLGVTSRWVTIAGRVEHGVKIFGYLQLGGQVFAIPLSLAQELAAIPDNLSPGERAARRAMAFLRAMRGGLESLGTAHQMLSEHVQVTEAAPPDPPAERTGEPSAHTGAGAGGPESRTPEARASARRRQSRRPCSCRRTARTASGQTPKPRAGGSGRAGHRGRFCRATAICRGGPCSVQPCRTRVRRERGRPVLQPQHR